MGDCPGQKRGIRAILARMPPRPPESSSARHRAPLAVLVFLSGAVSLVYEVLWLKELGLLFGSTAYAASTTLAVFFLGLAVGGAVFGRWSPRLRSPLRAYAWLELGIAASAGLYFVLLAVYFQLYAPLYDALSGRPAAFNAVRVALATLVLLPPATLMGGTLPVLAQYLVRQPHELGRTGSLLYAVNTLGAATGALLAGFVLPPALGFDRAYLLAMAVNAAIAGLAWRLAAAGEPRDAPARDVSAARGRHGDRGKRRPRARPAASAPDAGGAGVSAWLLAVVAGLSGALALGLEVLWTRMFAQVLQNSVYTFSIILVVFLAALAAGSAIANRLCRLRAAPAQVLWLLLTLAGLGVAATPFAFHDLTAGLSSLATGDGWLLYVLSIFANTLLLLFVPATLLGSVFPYLLRAAQGLRAEPGSVIGRLGALNTSGGVVGSLTAGFVLLGTVGLWDSVRLLAAGYLLLALLVCLRGWRTRGAPRLPAAVTIGALVLLVTVFDTSGLTLVSVNRDRDEQVLATWEGPDGVVAVVERPGSRRIKVNNFYTLGGTASAEQEQNQALLPLMTHPRPGAVFVLGLGTGITAGSALRHPVERLLVCEIAPDVIAAAAAHFEVPSGGLFSDPRATVRACDARNHLLGTTERFDMIIADLFVPWRAGIGNLYSREHFDAARARLAAGGLFVQWLPLYQLSRREFEVVARTMLDVFEQVTLWRGHFGARRPVVALVGAAGPTALDPAVIDRNGRHLSGGRPLPPAAALAVTLPFYAGNLSAAEGLIPPGPIHTDDRPLVEYLAPVTQRQERAGAAGWFNLAELGDFLRRLAERVPPSRDPHLTLLTAAQRDLVVAGRHYYDGVVASRLGRDADADAHFREFARRVPIAFRPPIEQDDPDADVVP